MFPCGCLSDSDVKESNPSNLSYTLRTITAAQSTPPKKPPAAFLIKYWLYQQENKFGDLSNGKFKRYPFNERLDENSELLERKKNTVS